MIPEVQLIRDMDNNPLGPTFGRLTTPAGFKCRTLERPAFGMEYPRVNAGLYHVHASDHAKHGLCYQLEDRDGRTGILIHAANWICQLKGCIALGRAAVAIEGYWRPEGSAEVQHVNDLGISSSRETVADFWHHMAGADFTLTIS